MAFVIIKTFLSRIERQLGISISQNLFNEMIQYSLFQNQLRPDIRTLEQYERPPMKEIPEYREKFIAKRKNR
jgi:glucosyl-3-phosphoglycerate synthase